MAKGKKGGKMRAFIALEISEQLRYEVAGLARRLGQSVSGRFVQPGNYHVTLAFLGDVDERAIAAACDALDVACEGAPSPQLACDGLGKFGKARDATLWLGIAQNDELARIATRVRDELASRDVAFDGKPFKPHITLARRAGIPKTAMPELPFPQPSHAPAVTLFKSQLDPEGAIYTPLHAVILPRAASPQIDGRHLVN